MKNYIVYQSDRSAGIVPSKLWNEFKFNQEIVPIRYVLCEITDVAIEALKYIMLENKEEYVNIINEELDACCLYSN